MTDTEDVMGEVCRWNRERSQAEQAVYLYLRPAIGIFVWAATQSQAKQNMPFQCVLKRLLEQINTWESTIKDGF